MSARPLLFVLLAGLAGVSIAQSGAYSSTFGDYQSWREGGPADWRAVNHSVAAADPHASHGAGAASAGHDHTGASAGGHDHGKGKSGMADMHKRMHGDGKGHDMADMHRKMHGEGKGHDMSAMHEKMHGKAGAGDHDHGAASGKKP
jgi:hypothetical protein